MEVSKTETNKMKDRVDLSYPILARSNYTAWVLKMKVNMQAHRVWDAVNPKDPKSKIEEKMDKTALVVIYQSIPEDMLLSIADKTTAKEAWEALQTMCLGADRVKKAKVQTLKSEFESMKMKESEQLNDFCYILNNLVANIRTLECRKPKKDKEQRLESNLAQTYDDEPALLMVEQEEGKVLLNEENVKPKLMPSVNNKSGGSNVWYLDNGASNHMTGERSKFKELGEQVTGKVRFGDGSTVDIKGKGSVLFKCKNGEEKLFHEVYFIPTLCNNILSLGQLSEEGNRVVMHGDFPWMYDKEKKLLMKVRRSGNRLYKILIESVEAKCLMSTIDEVSWL
ncbi:uncharacterized protein LOC141685989 [Apium graveolens]|uniref:uncharacterized protein LOC141685989 n=1 Tax=Apium graveolens TaxID=4045 RepID=UPI003D7A3366